MCQTGEGERIDNKALLSFPSLISTCLLCCFCSRLKSRTVGSPCVENWFMLTGESWTHPKDFQPESAGGWSICRPLLLGGQTLGVDSVELFWHRSNPQNLSEHSVSAIHDHQHSVYMKCCHLLEQTAANNTTLRFRRLSQWSPGESLVRFTGQVGALQPS